MPGAKCGGAAGVPLDRHATRGAAGAAAAAGGGLVEPPVQLCSARLVVAARPLSSELECWSCGVRR
eukprot:5541967-Pyramimonas_sp.AAC.1